MLNPWGNKANKVDKTAIKINTVAFKYYHYHHYTELLASMKLK